MDRPPQKIGTISGLPKATVCLLLLNTESNSTGFAFQPTKAENLLITCPCQSPCFPYWAWTSDMDSKCSNACRQQRNWEKKSWGTVYMNVKHFMNVNELLYLLWQHLDLHTGQQWLQRGQGVTQWVDEHEILPTDLCYAWCCVGMVLLACQWYPFQRICPLSFHQLSQIQQIHIIKFTISFDLCWCLLISFSMTGWRNWTDPIYFPSQTSESFWKDKFLDCPLDLDAKSNTQGIAASFRSQGNHRNQIFSVISKDIEETSCYRLQHHCYIDLASATIVGEGNVQDSHRVFVQEVCSNWVKGKRPSKFQSHVFIWSNSTNQILFAFMRWRKNLILSNPKLCEQHLEESKFAGREHRCQNHNPGFHMCTQTFAGKKETTHANGEDNNKTETMHLWTGRGVWLVLESPEALDSSHGQSASWSRCQKYSTYRKNATKLQGSPNPLRSISAAPLLPPKILLSEKKTKSKSQTTHPVSNHPKKKTLRLNNIHTPYSSPKTQENNPKTPPPSKESNSN